MLLLHIFQCRIAGCLCSDEGNNIHAGWLASAADGYCYHMDNQSL